MTNLKQDNQLLGISWMIFHCFLISNIVIIGKLLGTLGYNAIQIVFFQSSVAFLMVLPFALKKYGFGEIFKTKILHLHFVRAFLGVISMSLYYYCLKYVNLNDARAVALLGPVISFIFGVFFLKEVINNKKTVALIFSLIGGAIIINPTSPSFHPALFLIIVSMLMWSTIEVVMKKISKIESVVKQLLFLMGLMSLILIFPSIYYWKMPSSNYEFSLLLAIGALSFVNSIAIFLAIRNANLTTIMPFDFSGMIFTAILTYLIFAELIRVNTIVGSIVVFLSSLYLVYQEGKAGRALARMGEANVLKE